MRKGAVRAAHASLNRCSTLTCVLENPKQLVNVAAIVRNVDVLGVGKLFVVTPNEAWHAPNFFASACQKVSTGSSVRMYVRVFATTAECLAHLYYAGYVSVCTSPNPNQNQRSYHLPDAPCTASKLAVWFGNESKGISDEVRDASAYTISLPMYGFGESLNLGMCTAIVLYDVVGKRRAKVQQKDKARGRRGRLKRRLLKLQQKM